MELAKIVPALGQDRLAGKIRSLKSHSEEFGHQLSIIRVSPQKGSDKFHAMEWVPEDLKQNLRLPEHVSTFAAPYLLRGTPGSHRTGADLYPNPGCGHFLLAMEGKSLVIM